LLPAVGAIAVALLHRVKRHDSNVRSKAKIKNKREGTKIEKLSCEMAET
jgi:hypothetical protein